VLLSRDLEGETGPQIRKLEYKTALPHMCSKLLHVVQSVDKKKARVFASLPAVAPSTDLREQLRKFRPPPPSDPHSSGGPHTSVSFLCSHPRTPESYWQYQSHIGS